MSGIFWKNIHLCVPKFKCLPTNLSPPPVNDDHENATQINDNAAAAALIKNFNSIYDTSVNSVSTGSKSVPFSSAEEFNRFSNSSSSDDDEYSDHDDCYNNLEYFSGNPPDFSSVFASRRFFFSSPGKSNSIIDYYSPKEKISPVSPPLPLPPPPPLSPLPPPAAAEVENGIVAVQIQTYSPDPYADFRRSMQEMVEAHKLIKDLKADWNYLHELLLCYLSLNPKNTHKLIIGAFTDLIVSLTSTTSSSNHSGHRKTDGVDDNHRCTHHNINT